MLNIEKIQKFDTDKMYLVYDDWANIARKSFESNQKTIDFEGINQIVFAGMGGSGAIGDMFASILSKTKIHVNVVKGYILPQTVDSETLVVIVSVSGNTAETFSVLKSAHKLGSKIIAFSSGGKIEEYCIKNKIEHRLIPLYHSPRASFTSFLYTILNVLNSTLKIKKSDILESITELEILAKKINSKNLTDKNPAIELAKWIDGIPIIYYPFGLQSAAIRFKNSLQENAKMHIMTEDVIEVCHNGIVAWERPSDVKPILIQGIDDYEKTKERWEILSEYFELNSIEYKKIGSVHGAIITKLITLIYFLDYTSIYKAIMLGINPTPVISIDYIKNKTG